MKKTHKNPSTRILLLSHVKSPRSVGPLVGCLATVSRCRNFVPKRWILWRYWSCPWFWVSELHPEYCCADPGDILHWDPSMIHCCRQQPSSAAKSKNRWFFFWEMSSVQNPYDIPVYTSWLIGILGIAYYGINLLYLLHMQQRTRVLVTAQIDGGWTPTKICWWEFFCNSSLPSTVFQGICLVFWGNDDPWQEPFNANPHFSPSRFCISSKNKWKEIPLDIQSYLRRWTVF